MNLTTFLLNCSTKLQNLVLWKFGLRKQGNVLTVSKKSHWKLLTQSLFPIQRKKYDDLQNLLRSQSITMKYQGFTRT